MNEWENDGCGVVGSDFGQLFQSEQDSELERIDIGGVVFEMESTSRDNKHVNGRTGLMLWEGSSCMANIIMLCPLSFKNRSTIELGSGACPLPSFVASYHGAAAVVTDGSPDVLDRATGNFRRNRHLTSGEVVMVPLVWGDPDGIELVLRHAESGFDWVLGADVLYSEEGVDKFFFTAKSLLQRKSTARLLVCYMVRGVGEDRIMKSALSSGLYRSALSDEISSAACKLNIEEHSSLRLAMFRPTT
ncbi:hypothetical protein BSKO_08812 [Bryopsis sp. KO-2023]|nr:hypothetical protein BSKO_08812 [Bryopsis sp. KO-2023]